MSAEANASVDAGESGTEPDLSELALSLRAVRQELVRKIENGRVRDEEKEKIRIKRARALAYVVSEERKLKKIRDLEGLREDVDALKERRDTPAP
jgi:polyhydroxyalkanoate synthesis regulator phasin